MQFELTDVLVDQILFAMEDQNGEFVLDAHKGAVVEASELENSEDPENTYPLPSWGSADGFRLMEGFAASLRNPIVRSELTQALERGRGVFRAFKDVLSGHPEVERFWFSYKEKQMRQEILDWYNALRETWGLARIGEEPEDTGDLILEDFRFRRGEESDGPALRDLQDACGSGSPSMAEVPSQATVIIAETARGDLAGAAVSHREDASERIAALEVRPEYRGLGVGEELLSRLIEAVLKGGAQTLKLDLPVSAESFSRVLYRDGFEPYETRFRLDLDKVRRERS